MPRNLDRRIEVLDDERNMGNGWIVNLRPGFAIHPGSAEVEGTHFFGEDTMAEVRRTMKTVQPCECVACVKAIAGNGRFWT
jgi:hypothetical protein